MRNNSSSKRDTKGQHAHIPYPLSFMAWHSEGFTTLVRISWAASSALAEISLSTTYFIFRV
jgi:hypothetical protein